MISCTRDSHNHSKHCPTSTYHLRIALSISINMNAVTLLNQLSANLVHWYADATTSTASDPDTTTTETQPDDIYPDDFYLATFQHVKRADLLSWIESDNNPQIQRCALRILSTRRPVHIVFIVHEYESAAHLLQRQLSVQPYITHLTIHAYGERCAALTVQLLAFVGHCVRIRYVAVNLKGDWHRTNIAWYAADFSRVLTFCITHRDCVCCPLESRFPCQYVPRRRDASYYGRNMLHAFEHGGYGSGQLLRSCMDTCTALQHLDVDDTWLLAYCPSAVLESLCVRQADEWSLLNVWTFVHEYPEAGEYEKHGVPFVLHRLRRQLNRHNVGLAQLYALEVTLKRGDESMVLVTELYELLEFRPALTRWAFVCPTLAPQLMWGLRIRTLYLANVVDLEVAMLWRDAIFLAELTGLRRLRLHVMHTYCYDELEDQSHGTEINDGNRFFRAVCQKEWALGLTVNFVMYLGSRPMHLNGDTLGIMEQCKTVRFNGLRALLQ